MAEIWCHLIFHIHFFNMAISPIISPIYLRTSIHIAETCLEGRVSQNSNIVLIFYFMVCKIRDFEKNITKVTLF